MMIGGITLGPSGGTQPKPNETQDDTDSPDETSGGADTDQTGGTGDTQTAPSEGADTTTAPQPVEASPSTDGAGAVYGTPAGQGDATASSGGDELAFGFAAASAGSGELKAAAREMRLETETTLQIESIADPIFGPSAPTAPILNIVYNEGVEAASPPEQPEVLDITG